MLNSRELPLMGSYIFMDIKKNVEDSLRGSYIFPHIQGIFDLVGLIDFIFVSCSPISTNCLKHCLEIMELSEEEDDTGKASKRLSISEDRISLLPDSVLAHILSFLPTFDAIKTVQIRRFGNLWHTLRVFDFDECKFHDYRGNFDFEHDPRDQDKFLSIIYHILVECKNLDKLRLRFHFSQSYSRNEVSADDDPKYEKQRCKEESIDDDLDILLHFAIRKNVEVLDLDFAGCSWVSNLECYILPDIIWKGCYLTELRLSFCEIDSCEEVDLRSLKLMSLKEVAVNDEIMNTILQGCPLLETLCLEHCYNLQNLNCTNPRLEELIVRLEETDKILTISAPNLLGIQLFGDIDQVRLDNVSSVLESRLYFTSGFKFEQEKYVEFKSIFQKLSNCKNFTACTCCVSVSLLNCIIFTVLLPFLLLS